MPVPRVVAPVIPRTSGDPVTVCAIPFTTWGNRGPGAMRVWLPED